MVSEEARRRVPHPFDVEENRSLFQGPVVTKSLRDRPVVCQNPGRNIMMLPLLIPMLLIAADDIPIHGKSVVHFATVEEARALLAARDDYVKGLSAFDRQSRVEVDHDVSEDEFVRFVASHAQPWSADQMAKVEKAVASLRDKLAPYDLPFPDKILLVRTTGREEGNAAYCRRNAVIIPTARAGDSPAQIERLLNHELFHVLSTHNPKLREALYGIVGFHLFTPVAMPVKLRDRKLTNPDAIQLDAYITLNIDGNPVRAVPILFANVPRFDAKQGGPFFRYMSFQLMAVEEVDGAWRPVERDGEPKLIDPNKTPDYARQIGKNTGYIIHPDEILADNFVHMVQGKPNLPNPEIVEQMKKVLQK